jgi:hypothetical protein
MTQFTIYDGDSLVVESTVEIADGAAIADLSGATATATVWRVGAEEIAADDVSITGDTVTCTWEPGAITTGLWRLQITVAAAGEVQTVAEAQVMVQRSGP